MKLVKFVVCLALWPWRLRVRLTARYGHASSAHDGCGD